MTINVGFIGAGAMCNQVHYPSVAKHAGSRIAAICDLSEKAREGTADKYGVKARYSEYRKMLEREKLDAVYVVMPPQLLKPIILDCLAAGKHIFTEKPLGISAADARELAGAAAQAKRITAVAFNRRFAPVLAEARRRIEARGPVNTVMAEFHKDMKENYYPEARIPIIRLDIIHVVDVLSWIGGEVAGCHSYVDKLQGDDWLNNFNALIRFKRGTVGMLTANRKNGNRYERFELHGPGISAYVRAPETAEIWETGKKEPLRLSGKELCVTGDSRVTYGYEAENFHFLDCVAQGKEAQNSFAEAVLSQELAERIENGSLGA